MEVLKLMMIVITLGVQAEECDVDEIYQLTEIGFGDKVMMDGEIYDSSNAQILSPVSLDEGVYEISISRKESNFYEVNYKDLIIETNYCYEYAIYDDVILKWNGYGGTLIFVD